MAEINKLFHAVSFISGRSMLRATLAATLPNVHVNLAFLLGHFERRHGALYSLNHPSHGWPVSHAVQSGSIFFLISQVSPLQSPDLKAGRVKERRT